MRFRDLRKLVEQLSTGGGLVVGHWTDVDYGAVAPGTFPVDPTTLDFAASPVPWEFWMNFIRTAPGINGFSIMDPVGGEFYDADNKDEADSPPGTIRAIIPAGVAVQLAPSGDTSSISIDFIKRRTLG